MPSSMKAAIHIGPKYLTNSEIYKSTKLVEIERLFNVTQKLVMEHYEEILNVKWLAYLSPSWMRSVLSHDQAINWPKAKVLVYAEAKARWEGQVEGLRLFPSFQDAVGIDGEAIESEWKMFPGFSSKSVLQEIQQDLARKNAQPEEFKDRIIFMSNVRRH